MIVAKFDRTYEGWRNAARRLVSAGAPPEDILWTADPSLFAAETLSVGTRNIAVPKPFVALADLISCHRDEAKWSLLYRVLYRIVQGERHLLAIESDPDVNVLYRMRKEITHDMHRMKAFVRFRKVDDRYISWHKPDHLIVEKMAPWFAERFGNMKWSILTPDRSAHWDLQKLTFGPGAPATEAPSEDALEDLWRAYYASTFNPNRVNEKALRNHVPARYWAAMPETEMIRGLIVDAKARGRQMCEAKPTSAAAFVPREATLPILRQAVHACRGCDLYECATQPVFGQGREDAQIVLVGEQPGEQEDLSGLPFVGPAGQLLDRALGDAGLNRGDLYLTNAVRHFRFEERGKRRIHKTASRSQVAACQPWLEAELGLIRPKLIVCMGATALLSVLGRAVRVSDVRGQALQHRYARAVTATVHPSFLLRVRERQSEEYSRFVEDLQFARRLVEA
ncbi:MAG TPA: UdgX family uracil-DNA binding protein [Bryobacteraceae bacterium]|nr:UdgX family uracil-DNA binding protein [Bryobacteraceae bacterium]